MSSLHKDYAMLCSSTVLVSKFLFGDDLQAELIHMKATNKIGSTVSNTSFQGLSNHQGTASPQGCHFLGRGPSG